MPTRFTIIDELAGSHGSPPLAKHLKGQHDQSSHGRRGGGPDLARSRTTGEAMGLGWPVPSEIQAEFDAAVAAIDGDDLPKDARSLAREYPEVLELAGAAWAYAVEQGMSTQANRDLMGESEVSVFAAAMVIRARNQSVQDKAWEERGQSDATDDYVGAVMDFRRDGRVVIAAQPEAAMEILDQGQFLTQFDVGDSNGMLNPGKRAAQETATLDHHPAVDSQHRTVYGFVANPDQGTEPTSWNVNQYGGVRFVLKPEVAERSTMTVGDSLGTSSTPFPMRGPVTSRQVMDGTARVAAPFGGHMDERFDNDVPGQTLGEFFDDTGPLASGAYVEAQVSGGVRLRDVERVLIPQSSSGDGGEVIEDYARGAGIAFEWYED